MVARGRSVTAYRVEVGGRVVGHLFQRGDYCWLEWQRGYWDDPGRPVLGLLFEDAQMRKRQQASALRLPPWFSNLLPEGVLRDWIARDAGVSSDREMMLLRRIGHDLPGSVVIAVADEVDSNWDPLNLQPDVRRTSPPDGALKFSLAGVALKFSMLRRGERMTVPGSDADGDWIIKLPDPHYPLVADNEFSMMTMAHSVGINVPDIRRIYREQVEGLPDFMWRSSEEWAYGIKRFDRTVAGRVHMEDLAQVRGFYPENKYRGTFETAAALIYRGFDLESLEEFVRRLFFSFAVGNGDMHLKNISLLYPDSRRPTLSPTYDLVCTAPYRQDPEDLGLRLGRSRRFEEVRPGSFEDLAIKIGAPIDPVVEAVRKVAKLLELAWEDARVGMLGLPDHVAYLDSRIPKVSDHFSTWQ